MTEPTPIAVIAADTHEDEIVLRSRPEIRGDAHHGLKQVVDVTEEHEVDTVIIAGDVTECEPPDAPSSDTVMHIRKQMDRLSDLGAKCHITLGQHDRTPSHFVAVSDAAVQHDLDAIDVGPFRVGFMQYRRTPQLPEAMANVPKGSTY